MSEQPSNPERAGRAGERPAAPANATADRPLRLRARRATRPPSTRMSALLAGLMLAAGIAIGAAIGPAPNASLAGVSPALVQRLPALIAALTAQDRTAASTHASEPSAEAQAGEAPARRHRRRRRRGATASGASNAASSQESASASETTGSSGSETTGGSGSRSSTPVGHTKLPAVSSVWLIELNGESFTEALAAPASAPYIDGTLIPSAALLSGWSAPSGAALANEAALLAPVSIGGTPPIVHSIVQPACADAAAGSPCATPAGKLGTADAFLKEALAQITTTAAYREHGLVVVTFASVGVATEAGLPAGASSATLTYKPPAGVVVLSPFAKAGSRPRISFNPTSPAQSLEALLG